MNVFVLCFWAIGSFFLEEAVVAVCSGLIVLLLLLAGFISFCQYVYIEGYTGICRNPEGREVSSHRAGLSQESPQHQLTVFESSRMSVNSLCLVVFFLLIFPYSGQYANPLLFWLILLLPASIVLYLFNYLLPARLSTAQWAARFPVSGPLRLLSFMAKPYCILTDKLFALRGWLLKGQDHELTINELSKSMELSTEEYDDGKDLLEGLENFSDKSAVEIMTPREDMSCLDITVSLADIRQHVTEMHYSRIPIYEKNEDHIRGILYVKDLLPVLDEGMEYRWQQLIRPAYFVPETKKINSLLKEFRSNKIHLAIVVDEFGGTSGLVTMEDVLEEIVGEISDEYDDDRRTYVQLSDGSLIFEGKTLLTDFFRAVDVDESEFEAVIEDVDTLAGLLLELKGDFPQRQEVISFRHYRFQVLEMNKRRIVKVKFTQLTDKSGEEKE